MLRRIYSGILVLAICSLFATPSNAQWAIGGTYEIRNQAPEKGFGGRIEKVVKLPVPIVDLAFRGHFSYFSEENSINLQDKTYSHGEELNNYDYGLGVVGRVKLGMLTPYAGVGIGGNTAELTYSEDVQNLNLPDPDQEAKLSGDSKSKLAYYGLIGGEISLVPLLNPFVEYRLSDYSGSLNLEGVKQNVSESNGRLIFGVMLRF